MESTNTKTPKSYEYVSKAENLNSNRITAPRGHLNCWNWHLSI